MSCCWNRQSIKGNQSNEMLMTLISYLHHEVSSMEAVLFLALCYAKQIPVGSDLTLIIHIKSLNICIGTGTKCFTFLYASYLRR